jgi:hypothetical protein
MSSSEAAASVTSGAPRWRRWGLALVRAGATAGAVMLIALMLGPFQGLEQRVGMTDVLPAAGLALALGIAVELLQAQLGRSASLSDLAADLVGIVLAATLWPGRSATPSDARTIHAEAVDGRLTASAALQCQGVREKPGQQDHRGAGRDGRGVPQTRQG